MNDCGERLHIVMVSLHTSPLASPGSADAGGLNVVVSKSALALAKMGHRVDLVTRRDSPELSSEADIAPGVRVINLDAGPARPIAKSASESLIEPFRGAFRRWLNDHDADVVHSHHWFAGVAAHEAAHAAGLPHVQSYHSVAAPVGASLDAGEQPESQGRSQGEAEVATHSDLIVAVSEAEKATILERYDADPQRITVVHPGVDLEQFRPLRPGEEHWKWSGFYLFFAARLQPLKAPDLAIRALAEFPEGERPHLVVAGETSTDFFWYASELRDLADTLGVADSVLYLGSQNRDELARMMRGACVLLNPSRSETFGLINLEAAASGIPVIATKAGGMSESVVDGETGVLMTSRDPKDWAREAGRLLGDFELRSELGQAGRRFAQGRSWDVVAGELCDVYREVTR